MTIPERSDNLVESYGQTRKPGTCYPVKEVRRPVGNFPLEPEKLVNAGPLPKVKQIRTPK